jgi:glycosyltransferase involved in cell wall biosynthesis
MNIFFCFDLSEKKSGWSTASTQYLNKIDKKIIFCNKKDLSLPDMQYEILKSPLKYISNPILLFIDYFKIRKIIKENVKNYNASVHFLVEPYVLFLPLIKNFFSNVIYYAHGTYSNILYNNFKTKFIFLFCLKNITHFIYASIYTKKKLNKNFLPNKNCKTYIINCATTFKLKERKPSNFFFILSVGAVKERKGYSNLINVANLVVNKFKNNIKFYIAGEIADNNYFNDLTYKIKKFSLENHVIFLKKVSDAKLNYYYNKCSLFILLSKDVNDHFEGFGLVYLEALSRGKPIIVSKNSGASQLRDFNKDIFIADPSNVLSISDYINKIYKNKIKINYKKNIKTLIDYANLNFKNFKIFTKELI